MLINKLIVSNMGDILVFLDIQNAVLLVCPCEEGKLIVLSHFSN
jgi:hypothetical protein